MQFLVKGHLKNIQRLQIALTLRAREIFGLWKVYSNLTPNFTRNHVSTNLCCYLQAVPYHLRLRTRFHIRFKRHARRVGQVRHLSMKSCVLKTRAKPVFELSWKRSPFSVRAVRSISLEKQISLILVCCKTAMFLYENHNPPDWIFLFPDFFRQSKFTQTCNLLNFIYS